MVIVANFISNIIVTIATIVRSTITMSIIATVTIAIVVIITATIIAIVAFTVLTFIAFSITVEYLEFISLNQPLIDQNSELARLE